METLSRSVTSTWISYFSALVDGGAPVHAFYLRPDLLSTGVSYVLEEDVDLETTHDVTRYY